MSKNKNKGKDDFSGISLVAEGFESEIGEKIHNFKKEYREALEDSKNPKKSLSPIVKLIIVCAWIFVFRQFIQWGFGIVFIFITIFVLIFTNLGKRKPWELSAYSVFNPNFERLPGTLTSDDLQAGMGIHRNNITTEEEDIGANEDNQIMQGNRNPRDYRNYIQYETSFEKKKSLIKLTKTQSLNSECECGSGKKYKNCCAKNLKED